MRNGKNAKNQNKRIIFGLKVKQLRLGKKLSFAELSKISTLSVSYLNEIEKGKKYPKPDKIEPLAAALDVSYEELTSEKLGQEYTPVMELLNSNFLNELPLDMFGIELPKVIEIIANSPLQVGAFISTLVELSRHYALGEESFFFGALRAYQELNYNYFEDIENEALAFIQKYDLPKGNELTSQQLLTILKKEYKYSIDLAHLQNNPDLERLRTIFVPKGKKFFLNGLLDEQQRLLLLGRELAFNYLNLKPRPNISPIQNINSFELVLNNYKATYFAVALLINKEELTADLEAFAKKTTWDVEAFMAMVYKYQTPPEVFFHRLTSILPKYFGIKELFFLRINDKKGKGHYDLARVLHMNRQHHPHRSGLGEHYCRRWLSIDILQNRENGDAINVRTQRSRYLGSNDEYVCVTLAGSAFYAAGDNVSVTLGLLLNDKLREKIKFVDDPAVPTRTVNTTCERCSISDCAERAAPPLVIEKRIAKQKMEHALSVIQGR